MTEHFVSPGLVEALNSTRTENDVRVIRMNMADVITLAARRARHRPCPWCGTEPPLAAKVCGRFVVACEAPDCSIEVQATGATLEEVWAIWDARA